MAIGGGDSTRAVHGSRCLEDPYGSVVPPLYRSAIYRYPCRGGAAFHGRPLKYIREDNPSVYCAERLLALLEEGESGLGFNTGMSAFTVLVLGLVGRGDRVAALAHMYGTALQLLEELSRRLGFSLDLFYSVDEFVEGVGGGGYRVVFLESMTNPLLYVPPIDEVAKACRDAEDCLLVVDNTFTTPYLLKPLRLGASLVVHSATKYLGGHNDVAGGFVVGPGRLVDGVLWEWRRMTGSIMQPDSAYLVARGVKTLPLRVERQSRTARVVAEFLLEHPRVAEVYYPGLPGHPSHSVASRLFLRRLYGGVLSFRIRGAGMSDVERFLSRLRVITPAPSLGGVESTIAYPVVSSHSTISEEERRRLGITPDLVRLSVGLEDPEDLLEDLDRALTAAG